MKKEKIFYIGIAVILLLFFASQIVPALITSFSEDPPLFWWAVVSFPSAFLIAEYISSKYFKTSTSLIGVFLEKYLHVLLLFFSFLGFLIFTEITKT